MQVISLLLMTGWYFLCYSLIIFHNFKNLIMNVRQDSSYNLLISRMVSTLSWKFLKLQIKSTKRLTYFRRKLTKPTSMHPTTSVPFSTASPTRSSNCQVGTLLNRKCSSCGPTLSPTSVRWQTPQTMEDWRSLVACSRAVGHLAREEVPVRPQTARSTFLHCKIN